MITSSIRATLSLSLLALVATATGTCHAGFISVAETRDFVAHFAGSGGSVNEGTLSAQSTLARHYDQSGWSYGTFSSRAESYVSDPDPLRREPGALARLYVGAEATHNPDLEPRWRTEGSVYAGGTYIDEFRMTPTEDIGAYIIRLYFHVHAVLHSSPASLQGARSELALRLESFAQIPGQSFTGKYNQVGLNGADGLNLQDINPWTTTRVERGLNNPLLYEFWGTTHLDLAVPAGLDAVTGQVRLGLAAGLFINSDISSNAFAYIDALQTSGLAGVTIIDSRGREATPESMGWGFSFESGMASPNIAAVPEPSGLVLGGLGLVLGGGSWLGLRLRAASR